MTEGQPNSKGDPQVTRVRGSIPLALAASSCKLAPRRAQLQGDRRSPVCGMRFRLLS